MMTSMQWLLNKSPKNSPQAPDTNPTFDPSLEDLLFDEVLKVSQGHPHLRMEDYDLDVVRAHIIRPIAHYMGRVLGRGQTDIGLHQPPLIVSGHPGIGKTTLLMMIDQALTQLDLGVSFSARSLFKGSTVAGYYSRVKGTIDITPLRLKETQTAVLSILDWRNIQRHWTYDSQKTYRETPEAQADFFNALYGKVIFVDDAEKEGHVYLVSQLAQRGILVVISSNLDDKALHIDEIAPMTVTLMGKDHRVGDIAAVCLPAGDDVLFDTIRTAPSILTNKYEKFKIIESDQARIAYARWEDIKDQPFLKDNFAEYFRKHTVNGVLLDAFPFFSQWMLEGINPGSLGHLYRFVHLIDAVHDLHLPFALRMTQTQPLSSDYAAADLEQVLCDYDEKTAGHAGAAAWVEITRCLSRLRSRQALNENFFPAFLADLR
jgi:hypothetical protein